MLNIFDKAKDWEYFQSQEAKRYLNELGVGWI